MEIKLPLLENPIGAIAFFREELEATTALEGNSCYSGAPARNLPDRNFFWREDRAIRRAAIQPPFPASRRQGTHPRDLRPADSRPDNDRSEATGLGDPVKLSDWKPFRVTESAVHPAIPAARTLFNLVPCNRKLEVAMAQTLDHTLKDVAAFAKNAGPQALRIDYLTDQQPALALHAGLSRPQDRRHIFFDRNERSGGQRRPAEGIRCGKLVQSGLRVGT